MATGDSQRDILLGLDQKVDTLIVQMATVIANATTAADFVKDHENRIRRLEAWRYKGMGMIAAFTFAITVVATASWHIWGVAGPVQYVYLFGL